VNNKSTALYCDVPPGACTLAMPLADHIGVDVFPPLHFSPFPPIFFYHLSSISFLSFSLCLDVLKTVPSHCAYQRHGLHSLYHVLRTVVQRDEEGLDCVLKIRRNWIKFKFNYT
jgi:hypothetical protein